MFSVLVNFDKESSTQNGNKYINGRMKIIYASEFIIKCLCERIRKSLHMGFELCGITFVCAFFLFFFLKRSREKKSLLHDSINLTKWNFFNLISFQLSFFSFRISSFFLQILRWDWLNAHDHFSFLLPVHIILFSFFRSVNFLSLHFFSLFFSVRPL